mgnify:CR=1 FL=1
MKKFLAILMLLAMCFSCAAMAETTDEDLAAAKTYLFMMYKDLPETTMSDYEVVGVINIGGIEFPITWTADSDTIKIVPQDNKMVTIDVNEACAEDSEYTLTATIADESGASVSESFAHMVPKGFDLGTASYDEIVSAGYELEEGAALEGTQRLFGTVVSIDTPFSAEYNNITVTIAVKGMEEYPVQCFRLAGEGADALAVGDEITVEGTIKNYKGTIEFDAGCAYIGKGEILNQAKLLENAYALEEGAAMLNATALKGVITSIDTPFNAEYNNVTVTMVCDGIEDKPIQCYRLSGEGADKLAVGDEIAVFGTLKNYKGTIEFDAGCTFTK